MTKILTPKQREVNRVVDALTQAIGQHKLRPGTRLIEAQIVESLQANRNHVQSALQRMASQGIVQIEANHGAMVARPSAKQAQEIFFARNMVECAIISCITPEKMARFAKEIEQQQHNEHSSLLSKNHRDTVHQLGEFHALMSRIADNEVLRDILNNLMVMSSLIMMLYQKDISTHCHCDEHQQIIAALRSGDCDLAQRLMRDHLDALQQQLDFDENSVNGLSVYQALTQS
ncbi:GntR family transcriptional regulator [Klebsiella sp. BIGb0407]|uniref:GntR family transcriptional regulator n=1 Tax=Klebsiella sp. BIGb0407 TaxID=2940603 RepID=UPI002169250C|nr:GntR family transcriptional regulator [Klebsiella sp. BIGb0407]MCS3431785.1 DNA-binding GntR family transcriptional regulator [Klebsiella sp. BIGb0407]